MEVLRVKFVLLFGVWVFRTTKKCAAHETKKDMYGKSSKWEHGLRRFMICGIRGWYYD